MLLFACLPLTVAPSGATSRPAARRQRWWCVCRVEGREPKIRRVFKFQGKRVAWRSWREEDGKRGKQEKSEGAGKCLAASRPGNRYLCVSGARPERDCQLLPHTCLLRVESREAQSMEAFVGGLFKKLDKTRDSSRYLTAFAQTPANAGTEDGQARTPHATSVREVCQRALQARAIHLRPSPRRCKTIPCMTMRPRDH